MPAVCSSPSGMPPTVRRRTPRAVTSWTQPKGLDLGGDPAADTIVVDFDYAIQPSCAFDPRWACPLAPPENRLDIPVRAGERLR